METLAQAAETRYDQNEYINLQIAQIFILSRLFFTLQGEKQPTKR
jgi:hypothetical protein